MNDEYLIELIVNIKKNCCEREFCENCPLKIEIPRTLCKVGLLLDKLADSTPNYWDIDDIKELICDDK